MVPVLAALLLLLHGCVSRLATEAEHEVERSARLEAGAAVTRPHGYLYPARLTGVTQTLQRHGIEVEETREDIELDVTSYTVESVTTAMRPLQGDELVTVRATPGARTARFEAGMMLVRTAQPLGALAASLLEPESADGLTAWNFPDGDLRVGAEFPILRVDGAAYITTLPAPPLPEKRSQPASLMFEEAYESKSGPRLNGSPVSALAWLKTGNEFVQVKGGKPMRVDAATGRASPMYDTARLAAALRALPTIDRRAADSIARTTDLRTDEARRIAVIDHENDLYALHLDGSGAVRLTSTPSREEMPTFSPDAKFVAFVRDNDLWVVDVDTHTERSLTTGGHDLLRHGKHDWVYFEELYGRNWQAYWWSPDSRRIAFLQIDSTPVKTFVTINDPARGDQSLERVPYPKPGEPNPRARLFTVTVAGGAPREVNLSEYSVDDRLITNVGWWPDSSRVFACVANRVQTWVDLVAAAPGASETIRLLRETSPAWVETPPAPRFLDDGSFLLLSDNSGWRHVYRLEGDGRLRRAVTSGEWDVRSISHVDEEGGRVLVMGTKDSPIAEHLYSVPLGGGEPERLTADGRSHRITVSPDGRYAIDTSSSFTDPPRVELIDARTGEVIRTIDTNPVRDLSRYRLSRVEHTQIKALDGFLLEATVLKPPDFDPANRYPVWFMTYGGPGAPSVSNSWDRGRLWDRVLATAGFVVVRCDPRSASGKGAASAWTAYKQLGTVELGDIEAAIRWVTSHPWADPDRVGISGHSYGGYIAAYCLTHSDLFAAGIAGAAVTDWRDYDSIYTERYMLTPQENPEGYASSSVVAAADRLRGRLLLVHGLLDDNVHVQNTTRLARALQGAGKQFELMLYPDARHGIGGRHYHRLAFDFIVRTLNPRVGSGPEESPAAGANGNCPGDSKE